MPAVERVLVIGGGTAGTAVAIALALGGVVVDVVEVDAAPSAHGSGLTLQGNALRVPRSLGVLDELIAVGYPFDTLGLRAPDPQGTLIMEIDDVRMGGPDLPATVGLLRSELAHVLHERARTVGVNLAFGRTYAELVDLGDRVEVRLSDGSVGTYDLVVGADGIRSSVRRTLGISSEPVATGMGIWRMVGPRPPVVTRTDLIYGGPAYIAGFCPTNDESCYAYLVEDGRDRSALSAAERLATVENLAAAYHGPWDEIRPTLNDGTRINYTLFETHVVPPPWHRGNVVLIGDAAHSCPPTLAQGAAMALEDAAVLAELLLAAERLDERLFAAFIERRYERARIVVDASVQLGRWLLDHEQGDVPGLLGRVAGLLSTPA